MKIEIRIGDTTSDKRLSYSFERLDDIQAEKSVCMIFLLVVMTAL